MTRPPHLGELPQLDDAKFIYQNYNMNETVKAHKEAISSLESEFGSPFDTKFFILGSYETRHNHEAPKDRLETVRDRIEELPCNTEAYLLEDLDEDGDDWANFYLKFRFTLLASDNVFLVAEDNDGGHELELGEVPLDDLYVFRRDYSDISIDKDISYAKYDAMMNTLFDLIERRGQLDDWQTTEGLIEHVEERASDLA